MRILLFISALLCNLNLCLGQTPELKKEIEIIVGGKDLKLGLALYDFSTGKSISINGNDKYPMQSVFKFPIGVALLDCVSRGEFSLSDSVTLTKADLLPDLWSPIRERWPEGVRLPLVSVMTYMVAHSDNSATDFLIHKIEVWHVFKILSIALERKKSISATPKQRYKARGRCSSIIGLHPMRWLIFFD